MAGGARRNGERVGALDGLRGLAIAGVLAYHAAPSWFRGGYLGVEVFFVLSGYLVVSLLLKEDARYGRVLWFGYAVRRLRRVGPALGAFLVALVLIGPIVAHADSFRLRGDVLWTATGLTNWHLIREGASYFGQLGRPPLVRHLWSLAIELQFYVACPLLVALVARRRVRTGVALLGGGIVLSALAMGVLYRSPDPSRAYYGTDARIGALLTGALLALLVSRARIDGFGMTLRSTRAMGGIGLGALAVLYMVGSETSRAMYPAGFLVCRLATVAVIVATFGQGWVTTALGRAVPRWLGTRSYSIYLWHWPLLALLRPRIDVGWPPAVAVTVALAGALVLGELSFRFVERPFLHPGRAASPRLSGRVRWSSALVSLVVVCVLLVHLPTVDPIASSLRAGQQVVAAEHHVAPTTTTTAAPAPTTSAAPAPPASVPPATQLASATVSHVSPVPATLPPGPPPGSVAVAAIGDSVMLGAAGPLQARLGSSGYIDAKVSRQFADGVGVARQMRDQGRLGQAVVVHLGTNGPPRTSDIDAMMNALSGVPHVLFLTVRMPRSWEAQTNQTLRATPSRYPSAAIVDWYAYSDGHRDWFESDGIHLKPPGARAYADLVGSALPSPAPQPPPPPPTTTTTTTEPPAPPPPTTTTTEPAPTTTTTTLPV